MKVSRIKSVITREVKDYTILLRNVPSLVMILFVVSTMFANIFANKELVNVSWLALDCGFLFSWIMFLCMDILTKRFGAKASIKLSFVCIAFTLLGSAVFAIVANIGGNWAAFYDFGLEEVNQGLNQTFGTNWFVLFGSMLAMAVAAIVNSLLNAGIGKLMKKDTFGTYSVRSYVSTVIGQFVDNMVFASVVSVAFFGWTWTQVFMCSLAGAIAELLAEVVFSPIGYKVCKKWEKDSVGQDYIDHVSTECAEAGENK